MKRGITLTVDGVACTTEVELRMPLADVLRNHLDLTGTALARAT